MNIDKTIELLLRSLESKRKHLNSELKHMPKGTLVISTNGPGRFSYFKQIKEGKRYRYQGIGSKPVLVQQLARKACLREYRQKLDETEKLLRNVKEQLPSFAIEELRKGLPKHFDRIPDDWLLGEEAMLGELHPVFDGSLEPEPISTSFTGDDPKDWMFAPYCANTSHKEDLIHTAPRGFLARSKSETGVSGIYDDLKIPYHYDELLGIRLETISPDFRGIRRDRAFIFQEHWGLQSESYVRRNLRKLQDYAAEGFILGKKLLITFDDEAGGINLPLIREQIMDIYHLS